MKKTTLAATGGMGLVAMALLAAPTHGDSRHGEQLLPEVDMAAAAIIAGQSIAAEVVEIELESHDNKSIWEIDMVDQENRAITVEVDGISGEILSHRIEDSYEQGDALDLLDSITLAKAIEVVAAVEKGALIEAELEHEAGELIWELELLDDTNDEKHVRINAATGELLL